MIAAGDTSGSGSSTTSAAPSSTSISTPTGGSVTSGLSPGESASSTATPLSEKGSGGTNKGAIAGGVIGGIALGILLTVLGIWLWRRRQASEKSPRYSGDFGPVSRTVSDPIYNPALGARTEFLRRDAASPPGNSSIDHTLLGSPFSPMKEINKAGGMSRNGTMTTATTEPCFLPHATTATDDPGLDQSQRLHTNTSTSWIAATAQQLDT
ncbi:gpi transamidase component pig-s [Neofusicoccum parvum]|uniref:Gpi transamidase component pig-s n=1 Tax=Neofusicoccum parvum TaxID=310453 RepID=A0ACB5S6L7_9PEZI|nr:gpi transamidase component pig-s [Neofusicoccum parvum]GME52194.1 gpi transamidase component pig-s [Neofusicoccum parvum]